MEFFAIGSIIYAMTTHIMTDAGSGNNLNRNNNKASL